MRLVYTRCPMKMSLRDWIVSVLLCSQVGCNSPSDNDPRVLLDLKKKCVEAGEKARALELEMWPACKGSSDPRFTYNAVLKTCLYADVCYAGSRYTFIMDAFSHSFLIRYDINDGYYSGSLPDLPTKPSAGSKVLISKFHELFGPTAQPPWGSGEP
jgi:hypothetical protein